jgi:carboxymethylenebutenolidase
MSNADTEKAMAGLWDKHLESEFAAKSTEQALATMTDNPHVNMVPIMLGAIGREQLHEFYSKHFLNQIPPDMETVAVSRTVGQDRVVDELVSRFTHSLQMDWLLPGIPPTGKRVEIPFVVIVQFKDGKIAHEHLYWDQASVLVQIGLLDRSLPVLGAEAAHQVLNPTQPMNELIRRAKAR